MTLGDAMSEMYAEVDACFEKILPRYEPPEDSRAADAQALIDYVTTLSKIHGERISIFTVPERGDEERFTRCDIGFGSGAYTRKGWGDDLHERSL